MKTKYEISIISSTLTVKEINRMMFAIKAHLSLQDGVEKVTIKSKQMIEDFDKSKLTNDGIR